MIGWFVRNANDVFIYDIHKFDYEFLLFISILCEQNWGLKCENRQKNGRIKVHDRIFDVNVTSHWNSFLFLDYIVSNKLYENVAC